MKDIIDISSAIYDPFLARSENSEGKKWSYSYVYYLEDIKNIYNIQRKHSAKTVPELIKICMSSNITSVSGKKWTSRNLLEIINALKNFKLFSVENNEVTNKHLFSNTLTLGEHDKSIFKEIYYNYFRFQEFHNLFLKNNTPISSINLSNKSFPVISFSEDGRFTNCFTSIIDNKTKHLSITKIEENRSEIMRFWDVYIKWGTTLGVLEKYPLRIFDRALFPTKKNSSIVYFSQELPNNFSIFSFIEKHMGVRFAYIPDVIYNIIIRYRFPLLDIKKRLIFECIHDEDHFRAQSASAIFIKDYEKILIPKMGNTYVTHLLKIN